MKVNVLKAVELGGKDYQPGVQDVPDHLYANRAFKDLVKNGTVLLVPRDESAQKLQAQSDARMALAAQTAGQDLQTIADASADQKNSKSFSKNEPTLKSVDEAIAKLPTPAQAASPAAESPSAAQASQPSSPESVPAATQAPGESES